ncbi:MAG: hypothetical protein Q7S16_00470 [bacterium]|nr:hypothetical protein [bacterium]
MENGNKDHYIALLRELLGKGKDVLEQIEKTLDALGGGKPVDFSSLITERAPDEHEGNVVEGVFNGKEMIGRDGKSYTIPQNYASKSKLVEGDLLKLTITASGSFIFKQIGPVERERLRGQLAKEQESDAFVGIIGDRVYKLLLASVTYYHGDVGDEVVLLVPKGGQGAWAAVENVIKS